MKAPPLRPAPARHMQPATRHAYSADAIPVSSLIRRSIAECCAADHHNDPALIAAWLRSKTAGNVAAWIAHPGKFCVVAVQGEQVLGFAMAEADQLLLCYVLPEFLLQGVGLALLQAVESHATAQGITQLHLKSTRTARAFYERNGFGPAGAPITAFGMSSQPMMKRLVGAQGQPP